MNKMKYLLVPSILVGSLSVVNATDISDVTTMLGDVETAWGIVKTCVLGMTAFGLLIWAAKKVRRT